MLTCMCKEKFAVLLAVLAGCALRYLRDTEITRFNAHQLFMAFHSLTRSHNGLLGGDHLLC